MVKKHAKKQSKTNVDAVKPKKHAPATQNPLPRRSDSTRTSTFLGFLFGILFAVCYRDFEYEWIPAWFSPSMNMTLDVGSRVFERQNADYPDQLEVVDGFVSREEAATLIEMGTELLARNDTGFTDNPDYYKLNIMWQGALTAVKGNPTIQDSEHERVFRSVLERVAARTGMDIHENDEVFLSMWRSDATDTIIVPHHDTNKRPMRVKSAVIYLSDQPVTSGSTQFPCFGGPSGQGNEQLCRILRDGVSAGYAYLDVSTASRLGGWYSQALHEQLEACSLTDPGFASVQPITGRTVFFDTQGLEDGSYRDTWHTACQLLPGAQPKWTMVVFKEWQRDHKTNNVPEQLSSTLPQCTSTLGPNTLCRSQGVLSNITSITLHGASQSHPRAFTMTEYKLVGVRQGYDKTSANRKRGLAPYFTGTAADGVQIILFQATSSGRWYVGMPKDLMTNSGFLRTVGTPKTFPSPDIEWEANTGPKGTDQRWEKVPDLRANFQ